jgi:riboflavin biosynthesis pyrimidine reductase
MRRLHPDPAPVDPLELIPRVLGDHAGDEPPHVVANFIASADGRATVDGGSTGLGDDGDRQIFRALRGCAGAVLVGTGTLEAEHYGALGRHPTVATIRARLGLPAEPPLVTITRSGRLPQIPLLDDPRATFIIYTGEAIDPGDTEATVIVERRPPDGLAPRAVLADLRATHGAGLVLCEGGPSLFGSLVADGVCDELFLTLAPKIAGGDGPPITPMLDASTPKQLQLAWVLQQDDSLYLRYSLRG